MLYLMRDWSRRLQAVLFTTQAIIYSLRSLAVCLNLSAIACLKRRSHELARLNAASPLVFAALPLLLARSNCFNRQATQAIIYCNALANISGFKNIGYYGCDPFNQNFWEFRSQTEWIGSIQPEKFRKKSVHLSRWTTFLGWTGSIEMDRSI